MSAFTIPPPVAKKIERAMRTFLWGTKDGRNRTALVAWHKVCHSKQEGGLGIKVISVMNDALPCKWLWRFSNEPEALWRRFVEDNYGCDNNGWDAKQTKRPYGTGLWRGICNRMDKFRLGIMHKVGNGRRTRFWLDKWLGGEVLKDKFPNLYEVTRKQGSWVSELATSNIEGGTSWDLDFKRRFTDTEIHEATTLSSLLEGVILSDVEDIRSWRWETSGVFSVKSCYQGLAKNSGIIFPYAQNMETISTNQGLFLCLANSS
ncbi:uncharacterized protein LOC113360224 [Papaver somniferum]|uniref:uncharacterized protein LOC113360224 n=1 Tax=Papaver somniferum TaxID=3469 RepID=UPI000E7005C8|nr:uncharacterized protein LOC113360224 [Papaver somniferum]